MTCPRCGSERVASVLVGMPGMTAQLRADLDAGRVVLGGCIPSEAPNEFECQSCGLRFDQS